MMSPLGCKDEATARLSYEKFEEIVAAFVANTFAFGCPLPCQQSVFDTILRYFHKNDVENLSGLEKNGENVFYLLYYSNSLVVEERVEMLVYDLGNFLVAVGGNLGLLLGFSCLSVLLSLINFINQKFRIQNQH